MKITSLDSGKMFTLVIIFKTFRPLIKLYYNQRGILNSHERDLRKIFFTRNGSGLVTKFKAILKENNYPKTSNDYEKLLLKVRDGYSYSRLGDGEYSVLQADINQPVYFDKATVEAKERLKKVLQTNAPKHLLGMIHADVIATQLSFVNSLSMFSNISVTGLRPRMPILSEYNKEMLKLYQCPLKDKNDIFEAGLFRNTTYERHLFLWKDKDILYITGSLTTSEKYGFSIKELFQTAKSINVIETVLTNALSEHYEGILEKILTHPNVINKTIVLSQGMAGTVLAHELASKGLHAIDFGQPFVKYKKPPKITL